MKIFGKVLYIIGLVLGGICYIWSFSLWMEMLGGILGFIVAMTYVSDYILLIIEIVKHGFGTYPILFFAANLMFFAGIFLQAKAQQLEEE